MVAVNNDSSPKLLIQQYMFSAISSDGRSINGSIEATTEKEAVKRLRERGQLPIRTVLASRSLGLTDRILIHYRKRASNLNKAEVVGLTRDLSIMLKAGQDIDRAMLFLISDTRNARRIEVLTRLRDDICAGSSFGAALSKIPGSFTALYVGLVRAGESSGILPSTLASLADLLELQQARMAKLRNALIYPTGLLLTGLGAVLILLIDVLPKFTPLFEQAHVRLPTATQNAIDFGQVVSANKGLLLASLSLSVLGFGQLRKWPRSRRTLDRVLLALPLLGPLGRDVMAARFARTLGTLIMGRVPLISALALVGAATTNKAAEAAILSCLAKVKDGSGLATSLAETKLFPNRMVSLFRIGEDTAQLGETALRAADIHDERIERAIEKLMNLLPPLLMLLIGGMVGAIVNALLQAMMSLNDIVS